VILDQGPAREARLGDPLTLEDVAAGPHVLRAVICRSDHTSIKRPRAFALSRFWVGPAPVADEAAKLERRAWPERRKPVLTLVSPQGEGEEARSTRLDVVLSGGKLSRRGYKVRVVLDQKELQLMADGRPRKLRLEPGKHRISVDLLDRRGTRVSAFNRTERSFEVK
jgi:hypothetical protein